MKKLEQQRDLEYMWIRNVIECTGIYINESVTLMKYYHSHIVVIGVYTPQSFTTTSI